MQEWRQRWRARLFRWPLPAVVGENPLEVAMISWGVYIAANLADGSAPSPSLRALPDGLEMIWSIMMFIGGISTVVTLYTRRDAAVAGCMYLFAATQAAFAVAILGAAGWQRGGVIGGFLVIIGLVCFVRGWWLKTDDAVAIRALVRARRRKES